jgi:hypothetical protein
MKIAKINFMRFIIVLLGALVISLDCCAYAASIPVVASLDPIVDGLRTPLKMALDSDGSIFVADPRSGGVVKLDQYGKLSQVISTARPASVVALIDGNKSNIPNGKILVGQGDYVAVLDQSGTEVARLGSGAGQFVKVAGIAVDSNGNIYVTDAGDYNVKKFNPSGAYSASFGSYGAYGGKFMLPTDIASVVTEFGEQIAVVDSVLGYVQLFTTAGTYQRKVGASGSGPLYFTYPVGVSFEYVNGTMSRMYIVDSFQGQIQAVGPDGSVDRGSYNSTIQYNKNDFVKYSSKFWVALQSVKNVVPTSGAPNWRPQQSEFLSYIGSYGDKNGNLLTPSYCVFDQVNRRLLVSNGLSNIVSFGIDGGQNPVYTGLPPVLTVDQPAITVNSPSLLLTGSVDPGCTIAASVDTAAQVSTASFPTASSWTVPVNSLTPGKNIVSITARNNYGATTTKTATIQYIPPTTALSINVYPPLTSQQSLVLSGTSDPSSYVYVGNAASGLSGQTGITDSGTWTYALTLGEGVNNITVTASRPGASTAIRNIVITLDTQAPLLVVSALADGSSTANQVQNISGTVKDPNIAGVTVNDVSIPINNGVFSYALSLVKGPNKITVAAFDSLGNRSTDIRTIIFTPALPKITVQNPADGSYTNVRDVMVSGSIDKKASVTVNGVAANTDGGLNWSAPVRLAAGVNTIEIAATDEFESVAKEKRTITYDSVAPVITITSPAQDVAVKSPGLTINGTASDASAIKTIKATLNGADKPVALADGEFTLFADFPSEGTYTVAVTVSDSAGNISTAQRTMVYDITPPSLTIDKVTVPYPFAITGTVEAGAILEVSDSDGPLCSVNVVGQKWAADLSCRLYSPASLVVRATDAAGNKSATLAINPPVPDGDMDGDGKVTIVDALTVIRLVIANQQPTDQQLAHGDIGPLLNGKMNPKGRLDVVDAILILRKALGLPSWQ